MEEPAREALPAGRLLVIGGAEDPDEDNMQILPRVVELAGGRDARLLVCAAATGKPEETLSIYRTAFDKIGAAEVVTMPLHRREEAEEQRWVDALKNATGVFLTGGDQLRLTSIMSGTTFSYLLKERVRKGLFLAGTSAGAAAMSSTMISRGPGGTVRRADVEMAPGLNYWPDTVVDTHFDRSGRVHRLLAVLGQNPAVLGVGLDEDTAVDIHSETSFSVIGSGTAIVFDACASHTNTAEVAAEEPMALTNVKIHVLPAGYGFDIHARQPILPEDQRPD